MPPSTFGSPRQQAMGLGLPSRPGQLFDIEHADAGVPNALDPFNLPSPYAALAQPRAQTQDIPDLVRSWAEPPVAPQQATPPSRPRALFNQSTGQLWVNGFLFNENDPSSALASREYLAAPPVAAQPPGTIQDWRELGDSEYAGYLDEIENPSLGRRFGENFQHGLRGMEDTFSGSLLAIE